MKKTHLLPLLAALLPAGLGAQSVIFADTFNRADSRNVDATLTGITDTLGLFVGDDVYSHGRLDPNNAAPTYGVQDGDASNGGGAQVLGNQLQLAVGAGTSNAYINHNFIDAEIRAAGGFTVTVDVTGFPGTARQNGGGFALGMSAAEAASAGDAFNLSDPSMTGAFHADPYGVIGQPVAPGNIVSDFWIGIRGNSSLAWGSSTGNVLGVTGLAAKTGTVSVTFLFADFNAGSTVNYEVFLNGASRGTGSFQWSGTDENYIGLDARDGTAVSFDNLSIAIPPPSVALNATPNEVSSAGTSESVTLDWSTAGNIPAGATYQILDGGLAVIDSGPVGTGPGTFNTTVNGTLGNTTFTIEISDTTPAVIATGTATVTAIDPAYAETQTGVRFDGTVSTPQPVQITIDPSNLPAGATFEITDDNGAAVSYNTPTSGSVSGPIVIDLDYTPDQGSVTLTLVLKDSGGNTFDTRSYTIEAAASAPPIVTNLFSDTFDRYTGNPAEDHDIDFSNTGMSGTLAPPNPPVDFYREVFEGSGSGSLQIDSFDSLLAANGAGMSAWAINHNFTDAVIGTDGGLSIGLGVEVISSAIGDDADRYVGFGVGMSEAETLAMGDEANVNQRGPRGGIVADVSRGMSDFHVSVSLTDMVQIFANGIIVGEFPVDGDGQFGSEFGIADPPIRIRADLTFEDGVTFAAGSFVHYTVYCDDLAVSSGYFQLTQTGENFIGFSARAASYTASQDLVIGTVATSYPGNPSDPAASVALLNPVIEGGLVSSFDLSLAGGAGIFYEVEKDTGLSSFEGIGIPGAGVPGFPSATRWGIADGSGMLSIPLIEPPAGFEANAFFRGKAFHWPAP